MIPARFRSRIGASILLMAVVLAVEGCDAPDREKQLRETMQAMASGLEQDDASAFLDHVADDFSGQRGAWDAARVKRFVIGQTLSRESFSIDLESVEITLHGDRASAVVETGIRGQRHWAPTGGAIYRFETGWRLDGGDWVVIRADWKRIR